MPADDRRIRLLQEALRLVSEAGLGAVTHRSVERAAGAPHGSVTYWFGNRDGLISALVDWLCEESERQVAAIAAPVEEQLAAGQAPDADAVAAALAAWMAAQPPTTSRAWSWSSRARASPPTPRG
jgi:DNA-binding transcriptional regulator YbjK